MRDEPLHFRAPPEVREALHRACGETERTASALIRLYIREGLRRDGYLPTAASPVRS
jgi:hypothetical protein